MTAKILDGNALAQKLKEQVTKEVEAINHNGGDVGLAVILIGDDPASRIYVNHKKKDCVECGITSHEYQLSSDTSAEQVFELISNLNANDAINGILIQQPFPAHIDVKAVNEAVSPLKDVDAFRTDTVGKIAIGNYGGNPSSELSTLNSTFLPCTPAGVMELIHSSGVSISGSECVVVGRSNIVGKPMALMLLNENATVTVCHSRTRDLGEVTRRADILVSAVGRANLITADMVKNGAVVIDVGMNRGADGKLCGDIDYAKVSQKASFITPVPGGVGPMTRAILMQNTLTAHKLQNGA
ncbi:MAG: bifunctional 5,10-methylene-tetrahydrofolate dehydrogenase/5,10-methylene-tetrahydrofolate cyclohydrolase [Oscillospiraceae bacterium]|nr:bifunctional 5,10-methylene-tetrahydrofolate dehydrogenase/5,10-methylene-tetrahydrofolate cyclohydrolase [Oscillospiraceae bacterium]